MVADFAKDASLGVCHGCVFGDSSTPASSSSLTYQHQAPAEFRASSHLRFRLNMGSIHTLASLSSALSRAHVDVEKGLVVTLTTEKVAVCNRQADNIALSQQVLQNLVRISADFPLPLHQPAVLRRQRELRRSSHDGRQLASTDVLQTNTFHTFLSSGHPPLAIRPVVESLCLGFGFAARRRVCRHGGQRWRRRHGRSVLYQGTVPVTQVGTIRLLPTYCCFNLALG